MSKIVPVILCGGAGARLWPLSREDVPKQCLALDGERSLLETTLARVADRDAFAAPIVTATRSCRAAVADRLEALKLGDASLIVEPERRNTAPAIAAAAAHVLARRGDAPLLVMPADHAIGEPETLLATVASARRLAERGRIVLFGVPPTRPDSRYGYIRPGAPIAGTPAASKVLGFKEKPDRATAERLRAEGWLWNSGIFLFSARAILEEIEKFEPRLAKIVHEVVGSATESRGHVELPPAYVTLPDLAIDRAVMERTQTAVVIPTEMGWSDLGTWSALSERAAKDAAGNACLGDVHAASSRRCYLRSEGPALAAIGLDDVIVVATEGAVLVCAGREEDRLAAVVRDLPRRAGAAAVRSEHRAALPGDTEPLFAGPDCRVSRILLAPGTSLSAGAEAHFATHWTIVSGSGRLVASAAARTLARGRSVALGPGRIAVLTNAESETLELIEVVSRVSSPRMGTRRRDLARVVAGPAPPPAERGRGSRRSRPAPTPPQAGAP